MRVCEVASCERASRARGMCNMHYLRWSKTGDPSAVAKVHVAGTLEERIRFGVSISEAGCWVWGRCLTNGYGIIRHEGKAARVHRLAYELYVGPIPEGMDLDHLCRNRACCNPEHLEPVTHRENVLRGESSSARFARRTHCEQGHEFDGRWPHDGVRYCKTCHRAEVKAQRKRSA